MARRVQGIPSLTRKLTKLRENTAVHVQAAMERAAEMITDRMRSLVPVEKGDLRDSIGWTWGQAPKGSISVSVGKVRARKKFAAKGRGGAMTLTIFAGNDKAFYARWVEYGIAPHPQGGQFSGTDHPGNPAQPFFFPAYRAERKGALAEIRKEIRAAVKEAVR